MLTENQSPAYRSTLSPTLDLFSAGYNIDGVHLHSLLKNSWESDPAVTLRIIYNLRSIHDGKSEKESFYRAFGWLLRYHPRTAIANLDQLVEPVIERPPKKQKKEEKEGEGEDWMELGQKDVQENVEEEFRMGFSHGYYKDLLNILLLAFADQLTDPSSCFTVLKTERPNWTYSDGKGKRKTSEHMNAMSKEQLDQLHQLKLTAETLDSKSDT